MGRRHTLSHTRTHRKRQEGFSMLEAMASAGILGVGLAALVNLQSSSVKDLRSTRMMQTGIDMADQVADRLATQDLDTILAMGCAPNSGGPFPGCIAHRSTKDGQFAPAKGNCTIWREGGDVTDMGTGSAEDVCSRGDATCNRTAHRIDIAISQPAAGRGLLNDTRVLDVWVCWRGNDSFSGTVYETQATRILTPEINP